MDRKTQADEIRRLTSAPDVMLGSMHAVTESGSLLAVSASAASWPYVSGAGRLIPRRGDAEDRVRPEEGLRRITSTSSARGCPRPGGVWACHSGVNKVLIINRELVPGRITVVFVDEVLGF